MQIEYLIREVRLLQLRNSVRDVLFYFRFEFKVNQLFSKNFNFILHWIFVKYISLQHHKFLYKAKVFF